MSTKAKYCALFGLSENASKEDIRKAYRKLAMKYHPDKNSDPKAHQVFIDLAEAYELLINDNFKRNTIHKKRDDKSFDQRKKEAEFRFKQQQEKERKEQLLFYNKLTSGFSWRIFSILSKIGLFFSLILLLETFLPKHVEEHIITAYSPKYNGFYKGQVVSYKTNKDLEIFINNPNHVFSTTHTEILIERTWFFYNPIKIWSKNRRLRKSFEVDFSVLTLFPLVPFIFILPSLTIYLRRQSIGFTVAYLFSFYFIGSFIVYFIFSQDRWLHLLSFGYL